MLRDKDKYWVIEIDDGQVTPELNTGGIYWVIKKRTREVYEVNLCDVSCTCIDWRIQFKKAFDGYKRNWVFCRHILLAKCLSNMVQLKYPEVEVRYLSRLPLLDFEGEAKRESTTAYDSRHRGRFNKRRVRQHLLGR